MDQQTNDHAAPTPRPDPERPRRRRWPRPNGRWTNPASPLQAARFALKLNGKDVVKAIRELCPGHAGVKCKLDVSKLSDFETNARRPNVDHIETFCRFYQKSAEELSLINWRDGPASEAPPAPPADHGPGHTDSGPPDPAREEAAHRQELIAEWLRDSLARFAAAAAEALARCPITLTEADVPEIITAALAGDPTRSQSNFPDDATPDAPAPTSTSA